MVDGQTHAHDLCRGCGYTRTSLGGAAESETAGIGSQPDSMSSCAERRNPISQPASQPCNQRQDVRIRSTSAYPVRAD